MDLNLFLEELSSYSSKNVFNPWLQNCPVSDNEDSASIRLNNLSSIFSSCLNISDLDLWVGRDLGWRGGRRTGVALVDEFSLFSYSKSLGLDDIRKATVDDPVKEQTAREIDIIRSQVKKKILFWNVFPYHPYRVEEPFSNRPHTKKEFVVGAYFLKSIMAIFDFDKFVAIGNDASNAMASLGIDSSKVRHPSYGGKKEFSSQLSRIYKVNGFPEEDVKNHELF